MASKTAKKPAKKTSSKKPSPKAVKKVAPKRASVSHAAKAGTKACESTRAFLAFSHKMVKDYAEPFTDANATTQPTGNPNHAIWILGHLAGSYHWFASMIDGGSPDSGITNYEALFGMGSQPVDDPSKYPSLAAMRKAFDGGLARIEKALAKLNDETLLAPVVGNSDGWLTSNLDCLQKCAWHNAWHLGHLTYLRKSLGMTKKA